MLGPLRAISKKNADDITASILKVAGKRLIQGYFIPEKKYGKEHDGKLIEFGISFLEPIFDGDFISFSELFLRIPLENSNLSML